MPTARWANRTYRKPVTWPLVWRYGFAVLVTAVALLLALVAGSVGPFTPALLFFAGVLTARIGGFGPALVSVAMGTLAFRLLLPSWIPTGQLGVFVLVSLISCAVTASLRTAKIHLSRILDSISDAFAVIDRNWRFQFVNRRAAELLRRDVDDLIGREIFEVLPDLDPGWVPGRVGELLFSKRPATIETRVAGLGLWLEVTLVDSEQGLLVFARDITQRHRDEEALHRSLEDLSHSNRELDRFASLVSHDFTQPLGSITSWAEVIRGETSGATQRHAEQILSISSRMGALLRLYLDYARTGTERPPMAPVALDGVVDRVLGDLGSILSRSGLQVVHNGLPTVQADAELMYLFFRHLIADAVRAPSSAHRLRIDAERQGHEWEVSIAEEGRLPLEDDEDAEESVRTAICRRIIELHEGRMWTESADGQRVVRVRIPSGPPGGAPAAPAQLGTVV